MLDPSIERLRQNLQRRYGGRLQPYGWERSETDGFAFTIDGIAAVFSAITKAGSLPPDRFDVQVESLPPGDYIHTGEHRLDELLELIERFAGPVSEWP